MTPIDISSHISIIDSLIIISSSSFAYDYTWLLNDMVPTNLQPLLTEEPHNALLSSASATASASAAEASTASSSASSASVASTAAASASSY
jgi:hypothetical protein